MKLKIVILEDKKNELSHLMHHLKNWSLYRNLDIEIFVYSSGEEFFEKNENYISENIAVFLLDIQMKKLNGIDVAKILRNNGYEGDIIFLTSFREYVFKGYEVHALNYLLKPVSANSLYLCLDEIAKKLTGNSYVYRYKHEFIAIPYKDIISFSSSLHSIDILTTKDTFQQYSTLNAIIEQFPNEFIRIHKSCIVNIAHINKITKNVVSLSNRKTASIGRVYMSDVLEAFTNYTMRFDDIGETLC